jgi:hypothetical protein
VNPKVVSLNPKISVLDPKILVSYPRVFAHQSTISHTYDTAANFDLLIFSEYQSSGSVHLESASSDHTWLVLFPASFFPAL